MVCGTTSGGLWFGWQVVRRGIPYMAESSSRVIDFAHPELAIAHTAGATVPEIRSSPEDEARRLFGVELSAAHVSNLSLS